MANSADPLTARADQVPGHLGHGRCRGLDRRPQLGLDALAIGLEVGERQQRILGHR